MTVDYLITGVTGGLGAAVLARLLKLVPASSIAVSSSKPSRAAEFEALGVHFRVADYRDPGTLDNAFKDVRKLFFTSSDSFDHAQRTRDHGNVVKAAKRAGVGHVYYSSLALGGYEESKIELQIAHANTEKMLEKSGLTFTNIRMGVYADAFPCFINWYPSTQKLYLPSNGKTAYASRAELGEAAANLMVNGGHENDLVLLTGPRTVSFSDIVDVINETTGRKVTLDIVSDEEYVEKNGPGDEGGKPLGFFQGWVSYFKGIENGDGETVDPLMGELLGREPQDGKQTIAQLLRKNMDYTWHQNYV